MNRANSGLQLIVVLALLSELLYLVLAALPDLSMHIPLYLGCYGGVFVIYWFVSTRFFDFAPAEPKGSSDVPALPGEAAGGWMSRFVEKIRREPVLSNREVLFVGVVFAVLFRLTLLFTEPTLSDDIYRYVWDGKVASAGINPFRYAPNAPELQTLRDETIYPGINHKEIPTIYPPVSQFIFWALYQFNPTVRAFKAAFVGLDLLAAVVLFFILKALALSPRRVLLYLWNPLIIIEFAGSGHSDVIGILFLLLSLLLLLSRRVLWSTVSLVLSFLTKFIAVLFLPVVAFFKKENRMLVGLSFTILVAALYLPYADAGMRLFTGLGAYADKWQFNSSLFGLLFTGVKAALPRSWVVRLMIEPYGMSADAATLASRTTDLALLIGKGVVALVFAGIFLTCVVRLKRDIAREGEIWVFRLGLILLGTFFLLTPTVYPWYLTWLVAFLAVTPTRAWVLLTGLVGLAYWVHIDYARTGRWEVPPLIKYLEYLPFFALLLFDALRIRLRRVRASTLRLESRQSSR